MKGGGHGDYHLIVLAPYSVQEMYDFVPLGFELAFKYCNPVMILADGVIGQMMEKVVLTPQQPRWTDEYIAEKYDWALTGKPSGRVRNVVTSLELDPAQQERVNEKLQRKYADVRRDEVRFEAIRCEDADYVLVAYGSSARICSKVVEMGRERELKWACCVRLRSFPSLPRQSAELSPQGERFLVGGDERGADGRGCPAGRRGACTGLSLRPYGRYRTLAGRGVRGAEVQFSL